ncbi:hypothetical protein Dsin_021405 [Dipteronia sinensis]|uniref:RNase H type-1 domain-containing protein n=1 Tax=Dipteronia sinensis TaxID=43782 RepID=A0AAE0A042_9ROSI|nr:hypothetical protein Dsin_021405 [Dipteronia sinensis]
MVRFYVVWWFNHHGRGSLDSVTSVLLNVNDHCIEVRRPKVKNNEVWVPPLGAAMKFSVDGSSMGNPGRASIGGVLRDYFGKVLGMFSLQVGVMDAISAEILAIHKA